MRRISAAPSAEGEFSAARKICNAHEPLLARVGSRGNERDCMEEDGIEPALHLGKEIWKSSRWTCRRPTGTCT